MNKPTRSVFHLPDNLFLGNHLLNGGLQRHKEKYYAVISIITEASMNRRDLPADAYHFIPAKLFSDVLTTRYYKRVIDDLKDWGIIQCDDHYIRGEKSLGYRLAPEFREARTKVVDIENRIIAERLGDVRRKEFGGGFTESQTDQFLLNNFNRVMLKPASTDGLKGKATYAIPGLIDKCRLLLNMLRSIRERYPMGNSKHPVQLDHKLSRLAFCISVHQRSFRGVNARVTGNGEDELTGQSFLNRKCEIIRCNLIWLLVVCMYIGVPGSAHSHPTTTNYIPTPYDFTFLDAVSLAFTNGKTISQSDKEKICQGSMQYLQSIEYNWEHGYRFISRSSKTGRIYSSLTNLPRSLRPRLSIDTGEPLVLLDICNSQPFLFNVLLTQYYGSAPIPRDVGEYIALTSQGRLYERLMEAFGVKDREKFKREFFGSVFFSDTIAYLTDNAQRFANLFPNVFLVIQHYKKGNFRRLAWTLQKAESSIIIDQVCGQLCQRKIPDLFVATIHDCVVVNAKYEPLAREIIMQEFGNMGLSPTIKTEYLG